MRPLPEPQPLDGIVQWVCFVEGGMEAQSWGSLQAVFLAMEGHNIQF